MKKTLISEIRLSFSFVINEHNILFVNDREVGVVTEIRSQRTDEILGIQLGIKYHNYYYRDLYDMYEHIKDMATFHMQGELRHFYNQPMIPLSWDLDIG